MASPPKVLTANRFRRDRLVPEWCGLPVPGTRLAIQTTPDEPQRIVPIDTKRMYRIGSGRDCDIVVADLRGSTVTLFHHRNGEIYVSASGGHAERIDSGGHAERISSTEPVELCDGCEICVGEIRLVVDVRTASIKDLLRSSQTDDDTTRINTSKNAVRRKRDVASPLSPRNINACTPLSACQKGKSKVRFSASRAVRFLDFNSS